MANGLLRMSAVLGQSFSFEALQAAMGDESAGLLDALDEALAAGMLREAGGGYQFRHALIRRTLYDGLSLARRQRLQQQVARTLEQAYAGRLGDHAAELAEHFAQSTDRADIAKAVGYAELAAQRAGTPCLRRGGASTGAGLACAGAAGSAWRSEALRPAAGAGRSAVAGRPANASGRADCAGGAGDR